MNQANQKVVVQTANMTLISIRSAEISYFNTFFSSFGTQSALIIGFICGSISQVPGIENPSHCNYFFVVLYWVTSAITVAASVHVLVCTIFISVFGQGLALRGPLGSMVRAVEGMIVEQQQVLLSFIISIVAFALQAIGMYWIMMDKVSAIASTIITLVGMYGWYYYSLRIYNRFNWNQLKTDYNNEEDSQAELDELDPNDKFIAPGSGTAGKAAEGDTLKTSLLSSSDNVKDKKGITWILPGSKNKSITTASVADNKSMLSDDVASTYTCPITRASETSDRAGFITIKTVKTFGDPWVRHYLVARGTLLFYYKDKRSYELYPQNPVNRRAIDLEGYTLVAGAIEPPYAITLLPADPDDIRKAWKFRCDTLSEFNNWIEIFNAALKLCNSAYSHSDLIVMPEGIGGTRSVYGGESQRG